MDDAMNEGNRSAARRGFVLSKWVRRVRTQTSAKPLVWARVRGRSGSGILEWGDGQSFGILPLGDQVFFSIETDGVAVRDGRGKTVLIGRPGADDSNRLLLGKIERALRKRGRRFQVMGMAGGAILLLFLFGAVRLPGLLQTAAVPGGGFSGGGGDPISAMTGISPSMNSGLTCKVP
ncbi:hypothetical protein ACSYAY_01200 [Leptospirillum ferriphilum]|nr:hypothetical protein [Leptospirillum ferriphilum]